MNRAAMKMKTLRYKTVMNATEYEEINLIIDWLDGKIMVLEFSKSLSQEQMFVLLDGTLWRGVDFEAALAETPEIDPFPDWKILDVSVQDLLAELSALLLESIVHFKNRTPGYLAPVVCGLDVRPEKMKSRWHDVTCPCCLAQCDELRMNILHSGDALEYAPKAWKYWLTKCSEVFIIEDQREDGSWTDAPDNPADWDQSRSYRVTSRRRPNLQQDPSITRRLCSPVYDHHPVSNVLASMAENSLAKFGNYYGSQQSRELDKAQGELWTLKTVINLDGSLDTLEDHIEMVERERERLGMLMNIINFNDGLTTFDDHIDTLFDAMNALRHK